MILGICDGHNSSACFLSDKITNDKNNKNKNKNDNETIIKYSISEERFNKIKNYRGLPNNSINYILNRLNNLNLEKPNLIAVGGAFRKGKRLKELNALQNKLNIPILYYNHHLCHSALYKLSNFKECLIITIDGGGDGLSSTVSIGTKNNIEIIGQSNLINSIGDFYASVTEVLGFKPMEDEGKVMSLSSYNMDNNNKNILEEMLKNEIVVKYDNNIKTFKNYLEVVGYESTKKLKNIFKKYNLTQNNFKNKVIISKYAQNILEKEVLKLINLFSKETNIKNIVFSGGVAQNIKLNSAIVNSGYNLFVPPFVGDEGLCVGASLLVNKKYVNLENSYLGYEINNNIIENEIIPKYKSKYKINYIEEKDIPTTIGNLIVNNKIVCICKGKSEFGPRALGNRSIISLPTEENKIKINKLLNRNDFMPFAPTILYEYIGDYFENPSYSPYMTLLFNIKKNIINKNIDILGVIHKGDNTTRAQTIKKEFNNIYYNIINCVNDILDVPLILNTSFNLHGYPIVNNEYDGINTFNFIGDYLLLGNYLFEKI